MKKPEDSLRKNIKTMRERMGLTQQEVADLAEISFRGFQQIEYGQRAPTAKSISGIARALQVTIEDLYRDPNEPIVPEQMTVASMSPEALKSLIDSAVKANIEAKKEPSVKTGNSEIDSLITEIVPLLPSLDANNLRFFRDMIRKKISVPSRRKKI